MRILVYPAKMEIGGSQLNAIELARGVAELGHDVTLFGPTGPLVEVATELDLEYVFAPHESSWPSAANIAALNHLVAGRHIDVVHGYEWGPAMDLAFGPHLRHETPLVTTVMSMSVPDFLPHHAPLVVGTAELAAQTASEYTTVHLMEPPIDTARNAPTDVARARTRFGFAPEELVIAVVCRMVPDLEKLQGTLEAIRATDGLATDLPVRLLVVGDGSGLPEVMVRASQVNAHHRREVVVVTGGLLDPRSAYEAADVVLGMGSSALRGLAFAKPLVVQGAAGFWRLVDESTLPEFLERGWYGENGGGARELAAILGPVLRDPWRRGMLGAMGRDVVVERFSLTRASADLARIYSEAIEAPPSRTEVARGMAHASFALARFKLAMAGHRLTEQAPRALRRELSPAGGGT